MSAGLFAGLDPVALERVTREAGAAMSLATATSMVGLSRDDTIAPPVFSAGIVQAHLLGAASMLMVVERTGDLKVTDRHALARDVGRFVTDALASMGVGL